MYTVGYFYRTQCIVGYYIIKFLGGHRGSPVFCFNCDRQVVQFRDAMRIVTVYPCGRADVLIWYAVDDGYSKVRHSPF